MEQPEQTPSSIQLMANSFDGVFSIKNLKGQYFFVSDNWLKILALKREDVLGKTDEEIPSLNTPNLVRTSTNLEAFDKKTPIKYINSLVYNGRKINFTAIKWVVNDENEVPFCICFLGDLVQNKKLVLAFQKDMDVILQNLCLIYTAENYCLKRIPKLVNIVENTQLSQILSDHVSVIMDRLNTLDEIFSHYKTRPSAFKRLTKLRDNLLIFLTKNDNKNQKIINDLIEVSRHRFSLYQLLVSATSNKSQINTCTSLLKLLNQEENFYDEVLQLKKRRI